MTELFIDIETRASIDVRSVGVYRYVEDPDFTVLMAAWALDDDPVQVYTHPLAISEIPGLWDPEVLKVAHNSPFERVCFSRFSGMPCGSYLRPEEWHDTEPIAAERAYPKKLGPLAKALGAEEKDSAGTRLINLFCKPNRKGEYNNEKTHPKEWADFVEYCRQDVVSLRDIHRKLGGWPTERERLICMADQRINDRGMKIDTRLARTARAAALANAATHEAEFTVLSGVDNPNSNPQVMKWIAEEGLAQKLPNLQAETVAKALKDPTLTPTQRRVLELRKELALVAAKKFGSALETVCEDGRLRGSFRFYGAHTGRWTAHGTQPHNLPRASFTVEREDGSVVHNGVDEELAIAGLLAGEGATPLELKKLVRPMFIGPLTVVDYSAIEARVIAWLAGQEWVLQAFRDGRDIYVETAKRMGGLTRSQGKVAVLALGYNGAVGSLEAMGAKGTENELLSLVHQYRKANPKIVRFWAELDNAFREGDTRVGRYLYVEKDGDDRAIKLPSGRRIVYHGVQTGRRITFKDYSRNGFPRDTYGGRLAENVTQGVARDLLGEALVRLEREGYPVVAHVHDEVLVDGAHDVPTVAAIMSQSTKWSTDLPLAGEGFVCERYRKG